MIQRLILWLRKAVVLGLVVLGLGLVAHGHRAPSAQDTALEAGLLAGFGLADLCGQPGKDGRMPSDPCPACTVSGFMPPPDCGTALRAAGLAPEAVIAAPRARTAIAVVPDPAHAPRAPPFA